MFEYNPVASLPRSNEFQINKRLILSLLKFFFPEKHNLNLYKTSILDILWKNSDSITDENNSGNLPENNETVENTPTIDPTIENTKESTEENTKESTEENTKESTEENTIPVTENEKKEQDKLQIKNYILERKDSKKTELWGGPNRGSEVL